MDEKVPVWSQGAEGFPNTREGFGAWLGLAARINPRHHVWLNNGVFWLHVSVLRQGVWQERVRQSLGTADLAEACALRDSILCRLAQADDPILSIGVRRQRRRAC